MSRINAQQARLNKDISELIITSKSSDSCFLVPYEITNKTSFFVVLKGPKDTPYSGGFFKLHFTIPAEYPFKCPIVKIKTEIFHPNVKGDSICLSTLSSEYSPVLNLSKLVMSISALLCNPNPEDPLNSECSALYKSNYDLFKLKASEITIKHASTFSHEIEKQ